MSYIKGKSFKIVSRFYVIYGDYEPIYVGYTNRTVKQRFREHQKDKDFSDYDNVEVKELIDEKFSFDFTWDYEQTCRNADQVSIREGQLVQQYGTQDSTFQKADGGGQTWNVEKSFVRSNKDSPKFKGLSGDDIKELIKQEKVARIWISSFVNHVEPVEDGWIRSFVRNMNPDEKVWLSSFINHMDSVEKTWLRSFTGNMKLAKKAWLGHFVSHMEPCEKEWLHNFARHIEPPEKVWLHNFSGSMIPAKKRWLHDFVSSMRLIKKPLKK